MWLLPLLPHCRSFLFVGLGLSVGLGRMIGFLLLAALLLFTIVQAAGIYKAITSCLRRLPLPGAHRSFRPVARA